MARKETPFIYEEALTNIARMESVVIYRTVTVDFELGDIIAWLWPPPVVQALVNALPHTSGYGSMVREHNLKTLSDIQFSFYMDLAGLMCPPRAGIASPDSTAPKASHIERVIWEIAAITAKYERLRMVVRWLGEFATPGAARFYFPSLGGLLSSDHVFHRSNGLRYKEPSASMSDINPLIREAAATVASGLLCEPNSVKNPNKTAGIVVNQALPLIVDGLTPLFPPPVFYIL